MLRSFSMRVCGRSQLRHAIGVSEFVVVGVLPSIAQDFSISHAYAAGLVSYYALALAVAPITALVIAQYPRRPVLLDLIGIFLLGNLLSAMSSDYYTLMLGRIITAVELSLR